MHFCAILVASTQKCSRMRFCWLQICGSTAPWLNTVWGLAMHLRPYNSQTRKPSLNESAQHHIFHSTAPEAAGMQEQLHQRCCQSKARIAGSTGKCQISLGLGRLSLGFTLVSLSRWKCWFVFKLRLESILWRQNGKSGRCSELGLLKHQKHGATSLP